MLIEVQNVYKEIHGRTILKNVNLKLHGGKIYGLQGENGSGKTMFMRSLAGLIYLDEGQIIINNEVLHKEIDFPKSIGVLLENPSFLDGFTGIQNLKMLASLKGIASEKSLKNMMHCVGLDPGDRRKYRKYSLGMKQRLGIGAALMENAEIILLDEPFNALDEAGKQQVESRILQMKDNNRIIVISCHDRNRLERIADVIISVDQGCLQVME